MATKSDLPATVKALLFYTQWLQSETCCLVHPPTSGQRHHPTVSAWVNGPWGRAECVCGGSLTVTLWLVFSVEITMDSNSEGSEGNLSPIKEDVYYGSVARRRIWRSMSSEDQYGMWRSFSPRWQFTLTMPEKAKSRCWTHAVMCWEVSCFV